MKKLLDFSYDYCRDNGFDFLILVPAEKSLFDYYGKCGFERFGVRKSYVWGSSDNSFGSFLEPDCELLFDGEIKEEFLSNRSKEAESLLKTSLGTIKIVENHFNHFEVQEFTR